MNAFWARIRARLVDDLKGAMRLLSVQLHLLALAVGGLYELAPTLDPSIAAALPAPLQAKAIAAYAAIGLLVRLIKQKQANG